MVPHDGSAAFAAGPGEVAVDCTLGGGGHALAVLAAQLIARLDHGALASMLTTHADEPRAAGAADRRE